MRHRKKRSAAITLVLAGAVSGCSEPVPQRDVYLSQAECQRDWGGDPQTCVPATDGRHSPAWYYGPSYYGRTWPSGNPRPSDNAIDAYRVDPRGTALADSRRTGTSSMSRSTSSSSSISRSSSSSSSSSGSSRGGFGSSGHSSVS